MKVLSIIELGIAFSYVVLIIRRTRARFDEENIFAILVCITLGWMAFCEALFYSAATKESAWLWHQVGAFGWSGFIGVTCWYFLAMAGVTRKMKVPLKVFYWLLSTAITFRFICVRPTALAEDIVQSGSGLGWTYVQTYHNPWTYLFLAYIVVYLMGVLVYLANWQKKLEKENLRHLAKGFVVLDAISVAVGMVTYFVIPYFTTFLPPMGWIALLIFLWGYSTEVWEYDLSHFELVLDPQLILDSSVEPMMITDTSFRILYCNQSIKKLFHCSDMINYYVWNFLPEEEWEIFRDNEHIKDRPIHNMAISLPENEAALMSINQVFTRRHSQSFYMVSMHDISQLRQNEIQMERMAYYDELTGLANRRRLGELLDVWEKNYQIYGNDFILIFLDLDNFKSINDRYGHDCGDMALIAVSDQLKRMIHTGDETFRLSGDEFVILHTMEEQEKAEQLLLKIKNGLREIDTSRFAAEMKIDASIGACLFSEFQNVRQMMKIADERMYEMKRQAIGSVKNSGR